MLPDDAHQSQPQGQPQRLNAPTGAWCSLTVHRDRKVVSHYMSQCTYRCVVLPDVLFNMLAKFAMRSQCTYRCVVLPDLSNQTRCASLWCLNAPTGAWCSLTPAFGSGGMTPLRGPGAPPAPGAPLRTGQHRAQSSTYWRNLAKRHRRPFEPSARQLSTRSCGKVGVGALYCKRVT